MVELFMLMMKCSLCQMDVQCPAYVAALIILSAPWVSCNFFRHLSSSSLGGRPHRDHTRLQIVPQTPAGWLTRRNQRVGCSCQAGRSQRTTQQLSNCPSKRCPCFYISLPAVTQLSHHAVQHVFLLQLGQLTRRRQSSRAPRCRTYASRSCKSFPTRRVACPPSRTLTRVTGQEPRG